MQTICATCGKTVNLSREAREALWDKFTELGDTLDYLDEIHKCCSQPYHLWVVAPKEDITELVLESLKEAGNADTN